MLDLRNWTIHRIMAYPTNRNAMVRRKILMHSLRRQHGATQSFLETKCLLGVGISDSWASACHRYSCYYVINPLRALVSVIAVTLENTSTDNFDSVMQHTLILFHVCLSFTSTDYYSHSNTLYLLVIIIMLLISRSKDLWKILMFDW